MEFTYFIGTDVSKNELDFAVMQGKALLFHKEIQNTPISIKTCIKDLMKLPGFDLNNAVFCLEHTGIYSNHLLSILHDKKPISVLKQLRRLKTLWEIYVAKMTR